MRVLVTGGAGYIGSHTVLELVEAGHSAVIADNFSTSNESVLARLEKLAGISIESHRLDLSDYDATDALFRTGSFDAVIHCAGFKAVGESVSSPTRYYRNNLDTTLSVVSAMEKYGVDRLVFSSSATVYGAGHVAPFSEDVWPLESSNPYGQTKVMIERILTDVAAAHESWRVALLRYFNPVGAHNSGLIGEDPRGVPNNLMPFVAQVAAGQQKRLTVHGGDYETSDGTGERDYIHVVDLAAGHVVALEHLDVMTERSRAFNLGTGIATSVLTLVEAFERASGQTVPYTVGPRREGDLAVAYADPTRAKSELGWSANRSVDDMCQSTWRWQRDRESEKSAQIDT